MKTMAWTKLHVGSAALIGIILCTAAVHMTWKPVFAQDGAGTAETDVRIVALQNQKIALLEKAIEDLEDSARAGISSLSSVMAAKVSLAEARIDLAVLQARNDTIVEQLRVILSLQERALEDERMRREFGRGSRRDLLEQEVAAIDTRIRILQVEANDN